MTDTNKVLNYYKTFDEWGRLDTSPGQLELQIVLDIIAEFIPPPASIFDLGGGAGRYSYELALRGYQMHVADLSPDLIEIAKSKLSVSEVKENIKSIAVCNATDLASIKDETHENILLFGPLYHLTNEAEIQQCLKEAYRVLKPQGKILASFIPYHAGLVGILTRSFLSPHQVDQEVLEKVYKQGIFNNKSNTGFQEGNYLKSAVLIDHFQNTGIKKLQLRSIRGIAYGYEKEILSLKNDRPEYYQKVMDILHKTAADIPIVETSGHAIFIGEK